MTKMHSPSIRADQRSLYPVLGESAPHGTAMGETSITATKETIDNDTEDVSDDDVLEL